MNAFTQGLLFAKQEEEMKQVPKKIDAVVTERILIDFEQRIENRK